MKKRLAAFALSLMLALGLCPIAAFASTNFEAGKMPDESGSAIATQAVKVKASYKETFTLVGSKHKATFTMSTKKVLRKLKDGKKMYPVTLKKYVSKSKKRVAELAGVVYFTDKRFGKDFTDVLKWPEGNVTSIAPGAFKNCKSTTLYVWSLRLTKKGVKNSLKGSKITTVRVPKKLLKSYKKYFTEANCGKKVKVLAMDGDAADYPNGDWFPWNGTMRSYIQS